MALSKRRVCDTHPLVTDELVSNCIDWLSDAFNMMKYRPYYSVLTFSTSANFLSEVAGWNLMSKANVLRLYKMVEFIFDYMEEFPEREFFGFPSIELTSSFERALTPIWGIVCNIVDASEHAHDCPAHQKRQFSVDCSVPNCLINRAMNFYFTHELALEQDYLLKKFSIHSFKNEKQIIEKAENSTCPLCSNVQLTVDEDFSYLTGCNHVFCTPCIATWMEYSFFCPVCNVEAVARVSKQEFKNSLIGLEPLAYFKSYFFKTLASCSHCNEMGRFGSFYIVDEEDLYEA